MYFVTAVRSPRFFQFLKRRCFGFYNIHADASAAIETNVGNLHDEAYDFVVLEQIAEGVPTVIENRWWYEWDDRRGYVLTDEPDFVQNCARPAWAFG